MFPGIQAVPDTDDMTINRALKAAPFSRGSRLPIPGVPVMRFLAKSQHITRLALERSFTICCDYNISVFSPSKRSLPICCVEEG